MKKSAVSNIFLSLFACFYIVTSMCFGIHVCSKEGTSGVVLLTERFACRCLHHEIDALSNCCSKPNKQEEPDDDCCQTSLYFPDEAQNVVNHIKIDAPSSTVLSLSPRMVFHLHTLCCPTVLISHAVEIVRGPDGGVAAITSMRL